MQFLFVLGCYCEAHARIAETFEKENKYSDREKISIFLSRERTTSRQEEELQRKTNIPKNYIFARVGINYIYINERSIWRNNGIEYSSVSNLKARNKLLYSLIVTEHDSSPKNKFLLLAKFSSNSKKIKTAKINTV